MGFTSMGHTSIKLKQSKLLTGLTCPNRELQVCSKENFGSKTNFCLNLNAGI